MAVDDHIANPYVGPQPFEQEDKDRFFGREREANELLSLVIANRMSLLYAQSGAGKTSLLNAKLYPMLWEREFDVLPVARVRGLIPNDIPPSEVPNPFAFNTLISWADDDTDVYSLSNLTLAEYLRKRPRPNDSSGLPAPRIIIFDQFEELFTAYPDRWRDRKTFFLQLVEALQGGPLFFKSGHIQDPDTLVSILQNEENPLSNYLRPMFSSDMQSMLAGDGQAGNKKKFADLLALEFNRLIRRQGLFKEGISIESGLLDKTESWLNGKGTNGKASDLNKLIRANNFLNGDQVSGMDFPGDIKELIGSRLRGESMIKLNRMLLEEAYPNHLPNTAMGDPLLRVLLVIREDFIAQLDPYLPDLPNQLRSRLRLMRLQQRASLEAVKKPLINTPRTFDEGVAENLVDELLKINVETEYGDVVTLKGEYVEPVQLQVVCENLWNDLPENVKVITSSHVRRFGDVNEALAAFYESTIATTVQQTGIAEGILRRFFERTLLTPAGTRGTVYRGAQETGNISNEAIDVLADRHIIRGEWRGGSRWYELTHDRFIAPILSSNKKWLEKNAGGREMLQMLETKARIWDEKGQRKLALLDEYELERAEKWLEGPAAEAFEIPDLVQQYVNEGRKRVDAGIIERERSLARRYRRFLIGLVLLLIPAAIAWLIAFNQFQDADRRVEDAEQAEADAIAEVEQIRIEKIEAERQLAIADSLKTLAESKAAEAEDLQKLAEEQLDAVNQNIMDANQELASARMEIDEARNYVSDLLEDAQSAEAEARAAEQRSMSAETARDQALDMLSQSLSFAVADVAKIQSNLGQDTLAVLLAKQAYAFGQEASKSGSPNPYQSQVYDALRVSLNGLSQKIGGENGGPIKFSDSDNQVRHVAYSPNGRWLAVGRENDVIRVRNLRSGASVALGADASSVRCLQFSPDGNFLVACRSVGPIQLWSFSDGPANPSLKTLGSNAAMDAKFSQDSQFLAVIERDGSLVRWKIETIAADKRTQLFAKPNALLRTLAVDQNDNYLATADQNGRLYIISDWTTNHTFIEQRATNHLIRAIDFYPGANSFATGGDDYQMTGGNDYQIRVWEISDDNSISIKHTFKGHLGPVNDLKFSSDGKLLASASSDNSVHVRPIDWSKPAADWSIRPRILSDHAFWVWSVDFSPDNQQIASGSGDGFVGLWVTEPAELVNRICAVLPDMRLTKSEWDSFIGEEFGEEYTIAQQQKPCPDPIP